MISFYFKSAPSASAIFCLAAFFSGLAAGDQTDHGQEGAVSAAFLLVNPGLRSPALGGDEVAAQGDIEELYSNPAGIGTIPTPELWATHNQSFLNTSYDTLAVGLPIGSQTLAFSGQYANRGSEQRTRIDSNGAPITGLGAIDWSDTLLNAGWALRMNKTMVGVEGKGWLEKRDGQNSRGWAADAGIQSRIFRSFEVGAAGRNLGPAVEGFALPRSLALGAAYDMPASPLKRPRTTLFAELEFPSYRHSVLHSGIEMGGDLFRLRLGYESVNAGVNDPLARFTFGAGLRIKGWKIDYAWLPRGDLGDQHRFAITLALGLTPDERVRAARDLDAAIEKSARAKASSYVSEGKRSSEKKDWSGASAQFSKALVWNPQDDEASRLLDSAQEKMKQEECAGYRREAVRQMEQKQGPEAAFYWKKVLRFEPGNLEAEQGLRQARALMQESRPHSSSENSAEVAYNKGIASYLDGQFNEALAEWDKVLRADPNRPFLREYMEKARAKILEQKLTSLELKVRSQSDQVESLAQQAYTLYSLGEIEKAVATWKRVLALDPDNRDAKAALHAAQKKERLRTNDTPTALLPAVDRLNSSAMSAYVAGNLDQAISLWQQALALDPGNPRIGANLKRAENEHATKNFEK